jgi:hypothetical protein
MALLRVAISSGVAIGVSPGGRWWLVLIEVVRPVQKRRHPAAGAVSCQFSVFRTILRRPRWRTQRDERNRLALNWAPQRPWRSEPDHFALCIFHFSFCTRFTPNWVLQWPQRPEPDQDRRRERNHRGRRRTTRNREDSGGPSRRLRRVRSSPCRKRGRSSRRRSCRSQQA